MVLFTLSEMMDEEERLLRRIKAMDYEKGLFPDRTSKREIDNIRASLIKDYEDYTGKKYHSSN